MTAEQISRRLPSANAPTAPTRRVTIRDVAARAGVSTAAASKVLRDAYGVSDSMRARVQAAISELGYRPSAAARGLRGKTFTIGVMLSDVHNAFFGVLIDGLGDRLTAAGYQMLAGAGGADPDPQRATIEALIDRGMDGLLLIAPVVSRGFLEETGRQVPTVVIGRHGVGTAYDTVAGNDHLGSRLIVDHLVQLGHRKIMHLTHRHESFDEPESPEQVRAQGYRRAMSIHGIAEHIDVRQASWSDLGGQEVARQILAMPDPPTAVHAGADVAAFGLLGALSQAGVAVPGEISVVGYDNTPMSAMALIGLSTVDQRGTTMGRLGADLLLERLVGRTEPRHELITPTLVTRTTSGPASGSADR